MHPIDVNAPDSWPRWATETVEVVAYDPRWPRLGTAETTALDALRVAGPSEHVGSTAIPGLAAKPIIDVQAEVADHDDLDAIVATLLPHGWHLVPPELDGRPWRRLFVRVVDDRRAAHLHLMITGSPRWRDQIAFRDALRSDDGLRDAYARLKRDLAARHAEDREAYTRGKAEFVCRRHRRAPMTTVASSSSDVDTRGTSPAAANAAAVAGA